MAPMSDIPVGSPPAPPGRHAAPGGWYPDPLDLARERYWDGWQWSRNTRASEVPPAYRSTGASAAPGPYAAAPGVPRGPAAAGAVARPAPVTADGVPLAGWWWRALAGLLDALLVGTVSGLLTLPFYRDLFGAFASWYAAALRSAQAGGSIPPTPDFNALITGSDQLLVMLLTFLVGMAYHLPLLRTRGATLGLMACGLRVVRVDRGRETSRLPWPTVLVRTTIWVLPGALGLRILTVADVLVPLWHPRRQTLHDLAAQTQVVRFRP